MTKLLKDIIYKAGIGQIVGSTNVAIDNICFDSRQANEFSVFVAIDGSVVNGHEYIGLDYFYEFLMDSANKKEAREMKEGMIADAKEEAKIQATKVIEQAQATIQAEKQAAISEIKSQVAELSLNIAEKVVRGELSDKAKQTKLVEDMLKEVTL